MMSHVKSKSGSNPAIAILHTRYLSIRIVQNQNSLLVKRQNDNTSPGDWPKKISP